MLDTLSTLAGQAQPRAAVNPQDSMERAGGKPTQVALTVARRHVQRSINAAQIEGHTGFAAALRNLQLKGLLP